MKVGLVQDEKSFMNQESLAGAVSAGKTGREWTCSDHTHINMNGGIEVNLLHWSSEAHIGHNGRVNRRVGSFKLYGKDIEPFSNGQ